MEFDFNDEKDDKRQIERILCDRLKNRFTQYLVKWKNLPHSENSWVDEIALVEYEDILQEYLKNKNELVKIRQDFPKNAMKPHTIIDAYRSKQKIYYVIRYDENGTTEEIEAKDMHKINIMECIEFLEQKKEFKTGKTS